MGILREITNAQARIAAKFKPDMNFSMTDDGLIKTPCGWARVYYLASDLQECPTAHLLFATDPKDLPQEFLEKSNCAHVAAFRLDMHTVESVAEAKNLESVEQSMRNALEEFCEEYMHKTMSYLTVSCTELSHGAEKLKGLEIPKGSKVLYFNNKIFHAFLYGQNEQWTCKVVLPTKRTPDGKFIQPPLEGEISKQDEMARQIITLAEDVSLKDAQESLNTYIDAILTLIEDNQSIYQNLTKKQLSPLNFKKYLNHLSEGLTEKFQVAALVGTMSSILMQDFKGYISTFVHLLMDLSAEEYIHALEKAGHHAKNKPLTDYDFGENAILYFRSYSDFTSYVGQFAPINIYHINPSKLVALCPNLCRVTREMDGAKGGCQAKILESIAKKHFASLFSPLNYSRSYITHIDENTILQEYPDGIRRLTQYDREKKSYKCIASYFKERDTINSSGQKQTYQDFFQGQIISFEFSEEEEAWNPLSIQRHESLLACRDGANSLYEEILNSISYKLGEECADNKKRIARCLNAAFTGQGFLIESQMAASNSNLGLPPSAPKGLEPDENFALNQHKGIPNATQASVDALCAELFPIMGRI